MEQNEPPFLSNYLTFFKSAIEDRDYKWYLQECISFTGPVNKWLDENMIKGSEENIAIAKKMLTCIAAVADCSLLGPGSKYSETNGVYTARITLNKLALDPVRITTKRLKNVLDSARG